MKEENRRGISLIVLVITVIVIIILASAVILTLNNNNPIESAKEATFKSDLKTMQTELNLYDATRYSMEQGQYHSELLNANANELIYNGIKEEGKTIKDIISSITNEYINEISIISGKLNYVGKDEKKQIWTANVIEGIQNVTVQELSQESNSITLNNTKKSTLKDIKIYGNSLQNGTPTPESPVAVESVGKDGKLDIVSSTSNMLLNTDDLSSDNSNFHISAQNITNKLDKTKEHVYVETPIGSGNVNNGIGIWFQNIKFIPGEIYTVSCYVKGNYTEGMKVTMKDFYTNASGFWNSTNIVDITNLVKTDKWERVSFTFQVKDDITDSYRYIFSIGGFGIKMYFKDFQLERGDNLTQYNVRNEIHTKIDLSGHEPLRKIGEMSDYIDYENSRIVRNIATIKMPIGFSIDTREEFFKNNIFVVRVGVGENNIKRYSNDNVKCNYFQPDSNCYKMENGLITQEAQYSLVWLRLSRDIIGATSTDNIDVLREKTGNWLKTLEANGNPLIIYYQLETPEYEPITLPNIPTFDEKTNITVNTGNNGVNISKISVKYLADK
ncbi:MAG: carbohydrate binding domain-containing protein [Clostridia bacterium]|nr:carbohydrate binding domain-containing protein [Clostridia bacterium]